MFNPKPPARRKKAAANPKASPKRGPAKPSAVGDILDGLLQTTPLGQNLEQAQIWAQWETLAGPLLAAHGRPHSIKDRTLKVEVDSTVWMHRYSYKKFAILRAINRMAQKELVSDLFFLLGEPEEE